MDPLELFGRCPALFFAFLDESNENAQDGCYLSLESAPSPNMPDLLPSSSDPVATETGVPPILISVGAHTEAQP